MDMEFRAMALAAVVMLAACDDDASGKMASGTDANAIPTAGHPATQSIHSALASPDGLSIDSGGFSMRLRASACEPFVEGLLACDGDISLDVSVADAGLRQTLRPASILLRTDALIHHGPLPVDTRPEAHSFVVSDVNADGHEDLLLWSGRNGANGGASYDVHLFDEGDRQLRFNQAFSDLTTGYSGLFGIDGDRITASVTSGCCVHVRETYGVRANVPVLVERITTDESVDGAPRTIIERLADGEMQVVDAE